MINILNKKDLNSARENVKSNRFMMIRHRRKIPHLVLQRFVIPAPI